MAAAGRAEHRRAPSWASAPLDKRATSPLQSDGARDDGGKVELVPRKEAGPVAMKWLSAFQQLPATAAAAATAAEAATEAAAATATAATAAETATELQPRLLRGCS